MYSAKNFFQTLVCLFFNYGDTIFCSSLTFDTFFFAILTNEVLEYDISFSKDQVNFFARFIQQHIIVIETQFTKLVF